MHCHKLPLQPADLPILPNGGTGEVEFVDLESANGLLEDPDYISGAAHDEDNFHDMDRMTTLQTTCHVVLEGPPRRRDTRRHQGRAVRPAVVGSTPEQFRSAWLSDDAAEQTALPALRCVRVRRWAQVPEPYAAEEPRFDGVRELWWPDQRSFDVARARRPEAWAQVIGGPCIDATATGFPVTVENRVVWPAPIE